MPSLILANASKNTAPMKPKPVVRTLAASELSKTAKENADKTEPATETVLPRKETQVPLLYGNAFSTTTASTQSQLPLLSKILSNVSKRNAPPNGLPAKKMPSALQLSMTATRSAETKPHAGLSVLPPREAKPPLTLPNALKPMTVNTNLIKMVLF